MSKRPVDRVAQAQKQYKKDLRMAQKAEKKQKRLEAKAQKKAVVSVHKRPIVCPPDKAGRHILFRLSGYLCRTLVVWLAAAGLVIFVNAALQLGVPTDTIFKCTFLVISLVAIALFDRWGVIVSALGAVGSTVAVILTRPSIVTDIFYGILSIYNAALDRLYRVGYLAYVRYKVSFSTPTPTEELLATGVCLLCVIVGLVFGFSLVKRVRITPPAILATTFLVVILTFNVYSNRADHDGSMGAIFASNLGIALVIVSFATVLVMAAYDRLYHVKDEKRFDTGMNLFEDSDRPEYPREYLEAEAQKSAEKAAKKASAKTVGKALRQADVRTVDEELSDYFGGKKVKSKKKSKTAMSPAEKKQKKFEARELRRRVRAVKRYDRVTEQARAAMGGFASAMTMLLAFLIVALPALTVTGSFETIEAIDEKMSYARDYVTAVLRGDDARLDELEYSSDKNNFTPHSTDLEQLEFTGKQIFYVESRYNTNYYLRGWIGTGYENGAWLAVDDATLETYRAMFDTDRSPAEEFRYNFYHYMKPELVDDENYTDHYLTKYQSSVPYGFVTALVSLRRVNSPSSLAYFPSVFKSKEGMFDYGTTQLSETTYVNYFDGIYTGRAFEENEASQATVAMTPVMTGEKWASNQAELIAAFNLQREVMMINERISVNADGTVNSSLLLYTDDLSNGTTLFNYQYRAGKKDEAIWQFYHDTDTVQAWGEYVTVTTSVGTIQLRLNGKTVVGAELLSTGSGSLENSMLEQYENSMTDAERAAFRTYLREYSAYTEYVYDTYTGTAQSEIIRDLAEIIKAQAHTEFLQETLVEEPDDPETEEYDPYSYTKREWIDIPADVSLAAVKNTSDVRGYVQRDLLVRNVIDHIIYELGCDYTITPDTSQVDEALDGVENFLTKTKEGYCVQFASASALILRELGIPTRYVEGYIASSLTKKGNGSDMSYGGYVRDYEAHAWIEVYFDGVGWIQYETTPEYYGGMYGIKSGDTIIPSEPSIPPELDTQKPDEPDTLPPDEETESSSETDTGDGLPNDDSEAIMKGTLITLGVLVGIALIAAVIGSIVSAARRAEEQRQSVVSQVLTSSFGSHVSEEDRREMSFSMVDSINTLLRLYDLSPKPGEFRDDYADRLTAAFNRPDERKKAREAEAGVVLPDLHLVMEAMAAEEFGHGMTVSEMKLLATFYLYLRRELKRRLPLSTRFYLRFVKRLI